MDSKRLFDPSAHHMGIVIVFPPGVTSLFNPGVHRLVREVESQLGEVFVTFALSGGATPDVDGAVRAARFAGCSSALVVHSEEWLSEDAWIDPESDTLWNGHDESIACRETARRVVAAYNQARGLSGIAA